jgi:hypothetical protein
MADVVQGMTGVARAPMAGACMPSTSPPAKV